MFRAIDNALEHLDILIALRKAPEALPQGMQAGQI